MGARYLKAEETVILEHYPTATRARIVDLIPNRTWHQIGVKARRMRVYRTSAAKGQSVREGRAQLKETYALSENILFDRLYPTATRAELLKAFPNRSLSSISVHAARRHLHRTKEAKARQVQIGREEARKEK
jgi:hypothetical protein